MNDTGPAATALPGLSADGRARPSTRRRLAFWFLYAFVLTVPWENSVLFEGLGTISRAVGIAALAAGATAALFSGRVRRPHPVHLVALLFVCWGSVTFLWSDEPDLTLQRLRTSWQLLAVLWLVWEFAGDEGAVSALMQAYILGASVSVFNTGLDYLFRRGDAYARYMAAGFNPNGLGLLLALGIPFSYYLALTDQRPWRQWLYHAYAPAAFAAILLTASRGAFVAGLAALLPLLWLVWRRSGRRRLATSLLAALALGAALSLVPATSWERIGSIGYEVLAGKMNERRDIWEDGIALTAKHPLIGVGAGAFRQAVQPLYGQERVAHNTFLGVLAEQGAVGLLLFLLMAGWLLCATGRLPSPARQVWRVALLSWSLGACVGQWEHHKLTWFLLALLLAHVAARAAAPAAAAVRAVPTALPRLASSMGGTAR